MKLVPKDNDFPERTWILDVRERFLNQTIYDLLRYEFHQERDEVGKYIPMAQRAPDARFALCQTVVNDSISFLFAEGRFPAINIIGDEENAERDEKTFRAIIKENALNEIMIDAATRGSIGSIAIHLKVINERLFFTVMPTKYLTPIWDPEAPDTLLMVTEQYKVKGLTLRKSGYLISDDDLNADFWFKRVWNKAGEIWFEPCLVIDAEDGDDERVDTQRTVMHTLGFVPMVWIKNLSGGDDIDGACTFWLAVPNSIVIDYQLSQVGRGLKYSSSPTLSIKTDNQQSLGAELIAGDTLILPTDGSAELLEIDGTAAKSVIDYVRELRKMALESVGGSRADADKLSAATSGRAMEMMNQALINLADRLRINYGEKGFLEILQMIAKISNIVSLKNKSGEVIVPISQNAKIALVWPKWFAPTSDDRANDAAAISTLKSAGAISTESAVNAIASDYDIEDIDDEILKIIGDQKAKAEIEAKMTDTNIQD